MKRRKVTICYTTGVTEIYTCQKLWNKPGEGMLGMLMLDGTWRWWYTHCIRWFDNEELGQ
jgi:hypothetical protein